MSKISFPNGGLYRAYRGVPLYRDYYFISSHTPHTHSTAGMKDHPPVRKKSNAMPSLFEDDAFPIARKISGGIGGLGKIDSRRAGQVERGMPPLVPRKVSSNDAASSTYHSSVASNAQRPNIHGRIDWSSK